MTRLTQSWWRRGVGALAAGALIAGTLYAAAPVYAAADTTPPSAPANLQLAPSTTTTDGTVVLTWNAVSASDLSHYQVFRYAGTGTPNASEITYLGRTANTETNFVDVATTEGPYKYAVMAVDTAGNASTASAWKSITANFPGNGSTIARDTTAPSAVTGVSAGDAFQNNRNVTIAWTESTSADLWRYLVYRKAGSGTAKMIGYAAAGESNFADLLGADGRFTYYVLAQDETGNVSAKSNESQITVDTIAPAVTITSPVADRTYGTTGQVSITATITDAGGYNTADVKYFVDGQQLTANTFQLQDLAEGLHVASVEVTDKAGNETVADVAFNVGTVQVSPKAPQDVASPAYSKSRTIVVDWEVPLEGDVTQYKVYRSTAGATATVIGTTTSSVTRFEDTVPADGRYLYHVVAMSGTAASPASATTTTTVDTVAPTIRITTPKAGQTYAKSGTLDVEYTVQDATSGYTADKVEMLLDSAAFDDEAINLASLTEGTHRFTVKATDRAGNQATKTVSFKVGPAAPDDDDDDDDEDEDEDEFGDVDREELMAALWDLRGEFRNYGHFVSLMAKLRNGNLREFTLHVIKHSGKHFSEKVAETLLPMLGYEDIDIDPESIKDSDIEGWENYGGQWPDFGKGGGHKGNGKGKNK